MHELDAVRVQVTRQIGHWRSAAQGLGDLDGFASPSAWAGLEALLDSEIRTALTAAVARLRREADILEARLPNAAGRLELEALRRDVVDFRTRFLLVEDVLEFYGDAVNTRTTPKLAGVLRGCDELARMAMASILTPLGRPVPPVLTYIHKGLGASVLRAGQRLWDGVTLNPAAAIAMTRHSRVPTALIHEAGHQVSAELGWDGELGRVLLARLAPESGPLAAVWASWSPEIVADLLAFVHTGYGAVVGLHDVVSGGERAVFALLPGDPHPLAYLRVLLGIELCGHSFGMGPWDDLRESWVLAHPVSGAPPEVQPLVRESVRRLPEIADTCLRSPLRAFGGRSLVELVDPRRVAPSELLALERRAGPAALDSGHWLRTESLRLLALSAYRAATDPVRRTAGSPDYDLWLTRLGGGPLLAAA